MIYELIPFDEEFNQGFALWELDEGKHWLYFRQIFDHRLVMSVDFEKNIEWRGSKNYSTEELKAIKEFLYQNEFNSDEVKKVIDGLK